MSLYIFKHKCPCICYQTAHWDLETQVLHWTFPLVKYLFSFFITELFSVKTSAIPVLEFRRLSCVCVCVGVSVCVSLCACARSECRELEAYGNCGLPTGLLGRAARVGVERAARSRQRSSILCGTPRTAPCVLGANRGLRPGCCLRSSKETRGTESYAE